MKIIITRIIISILFLIIAIYFAIYVYPALSIEIVGSGVVGVFVIFRNDIIELFKSMHTFRGYSLPEKHVENIRVSFSYLIRIKVDGKYLLVLGKHKKFQPVGGVYKFYDKYLQSVFAFIPDNEHSEHGDIRGLIKTKKLKRFIKWFNTKKNREVSVRREYTEELLKSGILPDDLFTDFDYEFIETKYRGVTWSDYTKQYELMRFDIFEMKATDKQAEYLKSILKTKKKNYRFFNKQQILDFGIDEKNFSCIISEHTKFILE